MAIIQNNRRDKFSRHVRKKIDIIRSNLTIDKIGGMFSGPKILSNSIPKAGTHLVEGFLEQMPGVRNAGTRTLIQNQKETSGRACNRISHFKPGAFYNAHLEWSQEFEEIINQHKIRVIFLIRNPKDLAVSRYKYITYIDKTHFAHEIMVNAKNDKERLKLAITGHKNTLLPLHDMLTKFQPWLFSKNTLICRFEDLVGSNGGGNDDSKRKSLIEIATHIGIEETDKLNETIERILKATHTKSSTFRKGQINSWLEEFDEETLSIFESQIGSVSKSYGY